MFRVEQVDASQVEATEQLGTKRKFWYTDNASRRVLFKANERRTGEDWAEKVTCELCALLGLPHVQYELGQEYDGTTRKSPGVVCETCAPRPVALILGNELLLKKDSAYPRADARKYKVHAHTVQAVTGAVRQLAPPEDKWMSHIPRGIETALDVFVGYIMLDAWVANQDRHHENWAALWDGKTLRLAPTFDHGACLAPTLSDEEREDRLTTRDQARSLAHFVSRARSAFYSRAEDLKPLGTIEAFTAFAALAPNGAREWLARLMSVECVSVKKILAEVPPDRMSGVAKRFVLELLMENKRRLLEVALS